MAIYPPDVPVVENPVRNIIRSIGPVLGVLQNTAVVDAVSAIEAHQRKLTETIQPGLGAIAASWSRPTITLPHEYKTLVAGVQAQLTAGMTGLQPVLPTITVPTFPRVTPATRRLLDDVKANVSALSSTTVVAPKLPPIYSLTVPRVSLSIQVPDMPWPRAIRPPTQRIVRAPSPRTTPVDPGARIDLWLSSIRADLPAKRAGMRWALHNSPDAVCQAAASAVELIDHVLVRLAPDSAIARATVANPNTGRFVRETDYGRKPTWAGRARVAVMTLGGDDVAQDLAASFISARTELVRMKHKSHLFSAHEVEVLLRDVDLFLRHLAAFE